jgi:hypothetical protein
VDRRTRFGTIIAVSVVVGCLVTLRPPTSESVTTPVAALSTTERIQVVNNGMLGDYDPSTGNRTVTGIPCERAHAAAGTVACLSPADESINSRLTVMGPGYSARREIPLSGFPDAVRVSPSGRLVGYTVVVTTGLKHWHTYLPPSSGIVDVDTGVTLHPSADFTLADGPAASALFSGVTFADDNRFYLSMFVDKRRYLVEGDIRSRTMRRIAENVESPALSPDGTRLALRQIVDPSPESPRRLAVFDLGTRQTRQLPESRTTLTQPSWSDNHTVLYTVQRGDGRNDVWGVAAEGDGIPTELISGVSEPTVSR